MPSWVIAEVCPTIIYVLGHIADCLTITAHKTYPYTPLNIFRGFSKKKIHKITILVSMTKLTVKSRLAGLVIRMHYPMRPSSHRFEPMILGFEGKPKQKGCAETKSL